MRVCVCAAFCLLESQDEFNQHPNSLARLSQVMLDGVETTFAYLKYGQTSLASPMQQLVKYVQVLTSSFVRVSLPRLSILQRVRGAEWIAGK